MRDIVCGSPAVALPVAEVPMIEPDSVRQLRDLHRQGWGTKRIARELGLAVTVRRSPPCLGVAIRSNRGREADATEPGVVDGDREEVATKRSDGEKLRAT